VHLLTRFGWRGAAVAIVTAAVIAGIVVLAVGGGGRIIASSGTASTSSPPGPLHELVAPELGSTSATGANTVDIHGGVKIIFCMRTRPAVCTQKLAAIRLTLANDAFYPGWTAYAPIGAGSPCARIPSPAWPCEFEYPAGPLKHLGMAYGVVTWKHGAPHATIDLRHTWVRRWHRDTAACLASFKPLRLKGRLWSNYPCAAWEVIHQYDGVGRTDGEDAADWPWLNFYPCRTRRGVTTCSNKVGDSYRYYIKPTITS
jgi:hypothetical protein